MKKLTLLILLVSLTAKAVMFGPMPQVVPSSSLPIYSQMQNWYRMIGVNTNNSPSTNFTVSWFTFVNEMSVALLTNTAFNSNIVQIVSTNPIITTNYAGVTNPPSSYYAAISPVVLWDVVNMNTNYISLGNTNKYWIDMGRTNQFGQTNIYGLLQATNDVWLVGYSNNIRGSLFSFAVVASGGNRTIFFPTNLTYFKTNGWTLSGSLYTLILTNGNLFRLSAQQHSVLETTWQTTGQ